MHLSLNFLIARYFKQHLLPSIAILALLIVVLLSANAAAQIYETQGQALIENSNVDEARTKAMENALKKALLVAGASVSSIQQVVNGLMTQDEINIRASGSVNAIELMDEIHADNMIIVTIRADIYPEEKQCFSSDFRKTLLMTRSHFLHREQANIGSIYALDQSFIAYLSEKLSASDYVKPQLFNKTKSTFSRLNKSLNFEEIKNLTRSLAEISDSHYILFSEIFDASFHQEENNTWNFWESYVYDRNFGLALYIYNGTSGELMYEKRYHHNAPWTFDKRADVDVNSRVFWLSEYGRMLDKIVNNIISDIDENLMCEATRAKIVQVDNNAIRFNLGARHGVKVGDEFSLLHYKQFESDVGITYSGFEVSSYTVKVTSTTQDSAIAKTPDGSLLGNIQINDLVVRH